MIWGLIVGVLVAYSAWATFEMLVFKRCAYQATEDLIKAEQQHLEYVESLARNQEPKP